MKEHNCGKVNSEYVIATGPTGWFLCMRHLAVSCQITHCPFCGEKLSTKDLKYGFILDNLEECNKNRTK